MLKEIDQIRRSNKILLGFLILPIHVCLPIFYFISNLPCFKRLEHSLQANTVIPLIKTSHIIYRSFSLSLLLYKTVLPLIKLKLKYKWKWIFTYINNIIITCTKKLQNNKIGIYINIPWAWILKELSSRRENNESNISITKNWKLFSLLQKPSPSLWKSHLPRRYIINLLYLNLLSCHFSCQKKKL